MNLNHPSAGVYIPTSPRSPRGGTEPCGLRLGGEPVSAVVGPTGAYSVLIGGRVVATGELTGEDGPLMEFFVREAVIAGGTDDEMAQLLGYVRPEPDLAAVVEALGGVYELRGPFSGIRFELVTADDLSRRIRKALDAGLSVSEHASGTGFPYIEFHRGDVTYAHYYKNS